MKEMIGGCCVCLGDDGWDDDPLVFCDGQNCNVAVHKDCYGIVTVPSGSWFCRKCEAPETGATVRCELCPSKTGAFKRTDNERWAHVVCALYIPEIKFGNVSMVSTMEPIILNLTPQERFYKSCCICESQGKECNAKIGACMNCKKSGCKNQFHVTCAQALGFLCVEAEKLSSTVKYCGYCPHHYSQLKKGAKLKTIPTFKLPSSETDLALVKSDSSATGCLENPIRSGTTEIGNEERKRKKHSCKPSSSTGNRDSTKVLPGVESTQKEVTAETDADQNSSSLAVNQEAHTLKTENSKSSGVRKKVKLPRVVQRMPSPNKRLSAPAHHPSTSIAPKTELTTSPKDSVESVASTNLGISIKTECTVTELAVDAGAVGPSTSGVVTTSEVEQVAASTMVDCRDQNELSSTSPTSTKDTVKELHSELDPAPPPKSNKPRRSLLPKAPPTGKRSSKRRKKEDKPTPSIVDAVYLGGLLHQPSHPVNPESIKPEMETHSLIQLHGSADSFTAIKAPPTPPKDRIYAPQMLGNELNPDSSTAKEMSESLTAEVDMQNVFTVPSPTSAPTFVNVPLPRRNVSSVVDQTVTALGSSFAPQGLAELLERQWEQGSQLLMEQAQPYDIASLLSSLHIIRQENAQLEDHVAGLIQRRDRLLAVNARLSVPLTVQPSTQAHATSTECSFNGHLKEVSPRERSCQITPYQPLVFNGIDTAEQHIEDGSRVNKVDHPVHPTGGLPSTKSPIQGSTGFSSFTPEMTMSSGTSTTEYQLPGLHPHSFYPVPVPTVFD